MNSESSTASTITTTARTLRRAVFICHPLSRVAGHCLAWLLCLLVLFSTSGCDMEWEKRAQECCSDGQLQQESGKFDEAYRLYHKALEANPYHPKANRMMAELLERYYRQEAQAIYYYNRYLDLQPDDAEDVKLVQERIALLQQILDGSLEDPEYAALDIIWAAMHDGERMWLERIHPTLMARFTTSDGAEKYRSSWKSVFSCGDVFVIKRIVGQYKDEALLTVQVRESPIKSRYFRINMKLPDDKQGLRKMWEMSGVREVDSRSAY